MKKTLYELQAETEKLIEANTRMKRINLEIQRGRDFRFLITAGAFIGFLIYFLSGCVRAPEPKKEADEFLLMTGKRVKCYLELEKNIDGITMDSELTQDFAVFAHSICEQIYPDKEN